MIDERMLTRGAAAKRVGCHGETIRYYERIGLLPPPPRSAGGHRLYGEAHLRRLGFIRRCRDLGFTIDEIRGLLRLADDERGVCFEVRELTLAHLANVRAKIADLSAMEATLAGMVADCESGAHPGCPVIEALSSAVGVSPGNGDRRGSEL